MIARLACASMLTLACAGLAFAGDEETEAKSLSIGDDAPPIDIAHWVKGEPLQALEEGNVYVVEFWATWCGPCRMSMPHLSELQQKYKDYDVSIIGVSDEKLSTVVGFLCTEDKQAEKLWYEKIDYRLSTDPDKSVWNDYFKAAGQRGIPSAFIVGKDLKVEWIGHPMGMDEPLEAVVHDRWDRDEFRAQWEDQQKQRQRMNEIFTAAREKDYERALELIDEAMEDGDNPDLVMQKHQVLKEMGRDEEAAEIADEIIADLDEAIAKDSDGTGRLLQKFNLLLLSMEKPDQAYAMGDELLEAFNDEPSVLNQIAWTIVDDERIQKRDLDLALKAAQRANELTEESDPAILDTLARVHYEKGDLKDAVKWQRKAAEHAGQDQMGEQIREVLKKYEAEAGKDT